MKAIRFMSFSHHPLPLTAGARMYSYLNPLALLEGFFRFITAFCDEQRHALEDLQRRAQDGPLLNEELFLKNNLIQIILFERWLKRRRIDLALLSDASMSAFFNDWATRYGSRFNIIPLAQREEWCQRFAVLDTALHIPLQKNASLEERRRYRKTKVDWDVFFEEIEDLL